MAGAFKPRIAAEVRSRVLELLAAGELYATEIAREVGISRSAVCAIRDEAAPAKIDRHGEVVFRRVKKRWYCESCEAWVMVVPCPACEARKAGRR